MTADLAALLWPAVVLLLGAGVVTLGWRTLDEVRWHRRLAANLTEALESTRRRLDDLLAATDEQEARLKHLEAMLPEETTSRRRLG